MLKSSNINSIIKAVSVEAASTGAAPLRPNTLNILEPIDSSTPASNITGTATPHSDDSANVIPCTTGAPAKPAQQVSTNEPSLAAVQLATGFLQIFEPPLVRVRGQLKELIGKQNKIYIDLLAEKFKLDNAEVAKLNEMMCTVKVYREKLYKIRKQMQNIYQRTKTLQKRASNIQTCKQKELQRKLQKQQQEESLIGGI